jgi:sigma-E factor negative regulatory protein RseB
VFIEPRSPQTEAMRGLAKVGAAFAYSRDLDGHQVTAVGEVPAATVEAIAEAVTKVDAALAPVARDEQRH